MSKVYTVRPTAKQRLAFEKVSENISTGGTLKSALIASGYSAQVAKRPEQVLQAKGFQQLCDEKGLTDDFLISSLVEDIRLKPQDRSKELQIAFKVKGKMIDKSESHTFQHITISDTDFKDILKAYKGKG